MLNLCKVKYTQTILCKVAISFDLRNLFCLEVIG